MSTVASAQRVGCQVCGSDLQFFGFATTNPPMGLLTCAEGHPNWRLNRADWQESGWRLTLPVAHWDASVERFFPDSDAYVRAVYDRYLNLPAPNTYRAGQHGMGLAVALALRYRMILLANAGVGIGKTYAYLLPALLWLKDHPRETILVSTRTILLQHQLLQDLEAAQRILGIRVPILLIKGQGQYLCMHKLQDAPDEGMTPELRTLRDQWARDHAAEVKAYAQKLRSLTRTVFRGRSDALGRMEQVRVYSDAQAREIAEQKVAGPVFSTEQIDRAAFPGVSDAYWAGIQVDAQAPCSTCSWKAACGWWRLKAEREEFHGLLVVNHGLLATDTYLRATENRALWPAPTAVIADEAHTLEDALRSAGAQRIDPRDVRRLLQNLLKTFAPHPADTVQAAFDRLQSLLEPLVQALRKAIDDGRRAADRADMLHVPPVVVHDALRQALAAFHEARNLIENALGIAPVKEVDQKAWDDVAAALERLHDWADPDRQDASPYVAWVEDQAIRIGDLDLSPLMTVLSRQALILTSGTLGIGDDFDLLEIGLGLRRVPAFSERVLRLYAPSPFDYPHQLGIQLVTNLPYPRPGDPDQLAERVRAVAAALQTLYPHHPRLLVLFTSKHMLQAVADRLPADWPLITDGQESTAKLADRFRESKQIIYFSTAAWEGLDAPGPKTVVIVQLPYPVPTDPLLKAKSRNAGVQTHNEEMQRIIIPSMHIRLIQGVGRAIRRADDQGTVVILDPRAARRFDAQLKAVLPPGHIEQLSLPLEKPHS